LKLKNKISNFFILSWKKTAIALIIWTLSVFLHNIIYGFFDYFFNIKFEEAFFFITAVIIIPLYFIISILYTFYRKLSCKKLN